MTTTDTAELPEVVAAREAAAEVTAARAEVERARQHADDLDARLGQGDASVTGADLAAAGADIGRAERLLEGTLDRHARVLEAARVAGIEDARRRIATHFGDDDELAELIGEATEAVRRVVERVGEHNADVQAFVDELLQLQPLPDGVVSVSRDAGAIRLGGGSDDCTIGRLDAGAVVGDVCFTAATAAGDERTAGGFSKAFYGREAAEVYGGEGFAAWLGWRTDRVRRLARR